MPVLAGKRRAVLRSCSPPLVASNQVSCALGQTFREPRRGLYSVKTLGSSECVESNLTLLAQAVSIVRPFEVLIYPRQSRFGNTSWRVHSGFWLTDKAQVREDSRLFLAAWEIYVGLKCARILSPITRVLPHSFFCFYLSRPRFVEHCQLATGYVNKRGSEDHGRL